MRESIRAIIAQTANVSWKGFIYKLQGGGGKGLTMSRHQLSLMLQLTSATSGSEMFNSYCAPCHGKDAKGNGPAATALKNPPANPDAVSKEEQWQVPGLLRNGVAGAHGSSDMPVWGRCFPQ